MSIPEVYDVDAAIALWEMAVKIDPTMQIWAQQTNEGGSRVYRVGPFAALKDVYWAMPPKKRGDEVFLAWNPCRLAFDCDGKGMAEATMDALVESIRTRVYTALERRYGLAAPHVTFYELDGSTAGKQSRHLFFDGAIFATMLDMRIFVDAEVLYGLAGIDMMLYMSRRSHCLRLPLAAKFGDDVILRPRGKFNFACCMVNVLPEHRPERLLEMPKPALGRSVSQPQPVRNILRWLEQYNPIVQNPREGDKPTQVRIRLDSVWCPKKRGVHDSNGAFLNVWFGADARGRPCITHHHVLCADSEECRGVQWKIGGDIDAVAHPGKYA